ncbi:MAG TPA: hypothetical protein VNZ06_14490 [Steroidobacteraceae bacterium]|jgi:hypothetical protein|nr:hypothetical protein [Steroidobacteraceae bacterium]
MNTTPWRRALAFYWAFAWRACLICLGLIIAFYLVAAPIESATRMPPRAAALFDLGALLLLLAAGACLALQWCSRARFGAYRLRVEPRSAIGLSFAQAARVAWAQFWRSAVVTAPIYFIVRWLLAPLILWLLDPTTPWQHLLDRQLIYLPFTAAIGFWAMREAVELKYRGFRLQWMPEPLRDDPVADAQRARPAAALQ